MSRALLVSTLNYNLLKPQPPIDIKLQLNCGDKSCQMAGKAPQAPAAALAALREKSEASRNKPERKQKRESSTANILNKTEVNWFRQTCLPSSRQRATSRNRTSCWSFLKNSFLWSKMSHIRGTNVKNFHMW